MNDKTHYPQIIEVMQYITYNFKLIVSLEQSFKVDCDFLLEILPMVIRLVTIWQQGIAIICSNQWNNIEVINQRK